jgi:hypothetical protein
MVRAVPLLRIRLRNNDKLCSGLSSSKSVALNGFARIDCGVLGTLDHDAPDNEVCRFLEQ